MTIVLTVLTITASIPIAWWTTTRINHLMNWLERRH